MDYEYDHDDYGPRVLWGRVIFFAVALLLVFLMGRCVGVRAATGAAEADLEQRVSELSSDKARLQQELEAAQATQNQDPDNSGNGNNNAEPTEEATGGEQDTLPEGGQKYTVQSGDTLVTIATDFYGDAQKYQLIVDANNLESTTLTVGQVLIIPPDE